MKNSAVPMLVVAIGSIWISSCAPALAEEANLLRFPIAPTGIQRGSAPDTYIVRFPKGDQITVKCKTATCQQDVRSLVISPYSFPISTDNLAHLLEARPSPELLKNATPEDLEQGKICELISGNKECAGTPPVRPCKNKSGKPEAAFCGDVVLGERSVSAGKFEVDGSGSLLFKSVGNSPEVILPNLNSPGGIPAFDARVLRKLNK